APSRRDDFGDSVWFSLSIGRRQNAEPRWLIPMLCRTGSISKREIGAIKMQPEETYVQISADWADRFLAAIGPDRKLQGNILVKRLDGTPDLSRAGYQPPSPDKKPHRGKAPFDPNAPKRKFEKRAPASVDQRPAAPHDAKPWAKKPGKPKFDTTGAPKHKKAKKRPT
ncbi:DbpA RNA binding domain-containing protein, partial [Mesorhizobium sp.]|uniref:DbpA RNA binding domain-containing protein n=1 Tax=Mesorhizobium sp. TaxID=1871066 RepID=UPI000FE8C21A